MQILFGNGASLNLSSCTTDVTGLVHDLTQWDQSTYHDNASAAAGVNSTYIFDVGVVQSVNKLTAELAYTGTFTYQLSYGSDGSTWTNITPTSVTPSLSNGTGTLTFYGITFNFSAISARYIRLSVSDTYAGGGA